MGQLLASLLLEFGRGFISQLLFGDRDKELPADVAVVVKNVIGQGIRTVGDLLKKVKKEPPGDDNWETCVKDKNDPCSYVGRSLTGSCFVLDACGPSGILPNPSCYETCPHRNKGG